MKSVMLNFRVTPEQRQAIISKAKFRGESLKDYFLNATVYRESRGKMEGLPQEDPFLSALAMAALTQEPEPLPQTVKTAFKQLERQMKNGKAKLLTSAETLKHLKARRAAKSAE
jgi:hypothetical protein